MKPQTLSPHLRALLGVLLLFSLASLSAAANPRAMVGAVETVIGEALLNGAPLLPHTTLFAGDQLYVGAGGRVRLQLGREGQAVLDSSTELTLAHSAQGVELQLTRGRLLVQQNLGGRLRVRAAETEVRFVSSGSRPALCDIVLREASAAVACPRGEATVVGPEEQLPLLVPAGFRAVSRSAAAPAAPAGLRAGQVSAVIPQTHIERGPSQLTAVLDSEILWQDLVRTERRGRVRIGLDDGSVLNVGSDSQLRVVRHEAATQQSELEMKVGKLRVVVPKLGPGGKFEIRTSTAVLGVIGTHFYVLATLFFTQVIVFDGVVVTQNILPSVTGQVQVPGCWVTAINVNQVPLPPTGCAKDALQAAMNLTEVLVGGAAQPLSSAWILVPAVGGATATAIAVPLASGGQEPVVSPSGLGGIH